MWLPSVCGPLTLCNFIYYLTNLHTAANVSLMIVFTVYFLQI
uniref:Uncharacterized protein n=1 Tax=Anguilla anguilla TaxID=7936 RepID=A0A0E9V9B8_ANGAN